MTGYHPTLIPFADGRFTADLGHHLIYRETGGFRKITPKRFPVLEMLAAHLDDVVTIDELIDGTDFTITSDAERFMQRTRVGRYVAGLRTTLNQLYPDAGNPEMGVIQTEYGRGFRLLEHWTPPDLSTARREPLT